MASAPSPQGGLDVLRGEANTGKSGRAHNSPHVPLRWCHSGQALLPCHVWKAYGRTGLVSLARMLFNNLVIVLASGAHEVGSENTFVHPPYCFFSCAKGRLLIFWLPPDN